jgi:hypothetical protein
MPIAGEGRNNPVFRDGNITAALNVQLLKEVQSWILTHAPEGPGQAEALQALADRSGLEVRYLTAVLTNWAELSMRAYIALAIALDRLPAFTWTPFTESMRDAWLAQNGANK